MRRILFAALVALTPMMAHAPMAYAQTDQQAMVDRSTLALQDAMRLQASAQPRMALGHARAVIICPQVFKAGFFFGASGGRCVMLARAGNGTWSYPAFYIMGGGSFGLQIGVQDSEVVMMIMTNCGLNAVLNSSFKFGIGGSLAIAVVGGGVQGDTTAAVGADIVAFMISRGAFAGVSLEGSILSQQTGWNQAYYGQPLDARQIVINMQGQNPGADPLREMLTRYGVPPAPPPWRLTRRPAHPRPIRRRRGISRLRPMRRKPRRPIRRPPDIHRRRRSIFSPMRRSRRRACRRRARADRA